MDIIKQPFQVGQKVSVSPGGPEWKSDWKGVELWVAGVVVSTPSGGFDIWVSDAWPPMSRGNLSDGWSETDLVPQPT